MVKFVCISDTHEKLDQIKLVDGDVLLIAGDITFMGESHKITNFNKYIPILKTQYGYKYIVMIAGNHDWLFDLDFKSAKSLITNVDFYLQDTGCEINGIKIWGSPWQPEFCNWAFNLPRGKNLADKWDLIPEDTDILITHSPPYGILDISKYGNEYIGCKDLKRRIKNLSNLKYHIFGHNHRPGILNKDGITFVNASSLDDNYKPILHNPFTFEL